MSKSMRIALRMLSDKLGGYRLVRLMWYCQRYWLGIEDECPERMLNDIKREVRYGRA